jgi:hypothetical protein
LLFIPMSSVVESQRPIPSQEEDDQETRRVQ